LGGTFNVLHKGHRALIDLAFKLGDRVTIGISSDDFAGEERKEVNPFAERKKALTEYLSSKEKPWELEILNDPMGSAAKDKEMEILIASPGSERRAREINLVRERNGLSPLRIVVVPCVLAEDYLPISSTRILSGEMDLEGRLSRPIQVAVGSLNPVKMGAVETVMKRVLRDCEVRGVRAITKVKSQPFEGSTISGAVQRAKAALVRADLGVGIEAGVFEREDGLYDVQYCAIVDKAGWLTIGHGSGFRYPEQVANLVKEGKDVSEAFALLYGEEDIGRRKGAIGFLTEGLLTRQQLTEQSVMAAMVPRIKTELYTDRQSSLYKDF